MALLLAFRHTYKNAIQALIKIRLKNVENVEKVENSPLLEPYEGFVGWPRVGGCL